MSSVEQLEAQYEAHRAEYSQYVAAEPIFIGGARAFNVGDPVPASHVKSGAVTEAQVRSVKPAASEKKGN